MKRSKDRSGHEGGADGLNDVLERLGSLKDVPARDPAAIESGRAAFLQRARSYHKPVSPAPSGRRKGWKIPRRKERSVMSLLARVALALVMLFGAAGGTVVVAQASEPGDVLYPVKLAAEDVRLALTTDSEQAFDLLLEMTQERFDEIDALSEEGEFIPPQVMTRLQEHLQLALQQAANLDDESLIQAMQRVHVMTQQRTQELQQMQLQCAGNADGALQETEQIVSRIHVAAEEGLEDPVTFRLRHGANRPEDAPVQPDSEPPGDGPGNQQGPGGQQGSGKDGGQK